MELSPGLLFYLLLVFAAVFLLSQGLVVPTFGDARKAEKQVRARLSKIASYAQRNAIRSVLRDKYLRDLGPLERWLELLPGMDTLARHIEQAGRTVSAYKLVMLSIALCWGAAFGAWVITRQWPAVLAAALIAGFAPFVKIKRERTQRLALFEEQLPDAVDVVKRALRAGHPFSESLSLVAMEMQDPIAKEFGDTFADINYGSDIRNALLGLLERVPSIALTAVVTSVLVQKQTGGNLAEILEQISTVIRHRFRFYRKVKTLSAEGRMSAWILALVPIVLFAVIWVTTPGYLPTLLEQPVGRKMLMGSGVMMLIGIVWINKIIRIEA